MPTFVHFEIPADDVDRSKKFYGEPFGWKIEKLPGETPAWEYWILTTLDKVAWRVTPVENRQGRLNL